MEEMTVSSLKKDMRFEGFLLVRSADRRTDSRGAYYVDLNLADRSGEINGKIWDQNALAPETGSVVKVRGMVQEYNGRLQFRVEKIRPSTAADEVDMNRLVPGAPEKPEDMLAEIQHTVDSLTSVRLQTLTREMLKDAGNDLLYFPGAQRMHHAERAGLLHHTVSMLRLAKGVLEVYPDLNRDLLLTGVILHDLGKLDEMKSDRLGTVSDYTRDGQLLGHLVRGITHLNQVAARSGIDGETVVLLEHMLLSHHGESEFGSPKPPMFPEAEALRWIDMLDARLNAIQSVAARTPSGAFSEKVAGLDRRVYHPMYDQL